MGLYATGSLIFVVDGEDLAVPIAAHIGAAIALLKNRMRSLAPTLALDGLIGGLTLARCCSSWLGASRASAGATRSSAWPLPPPA